MPVGKRSGRDLPAGACSESMNAAYSAAVEGNAMPLTFAYCSITSGERNAAVAEAWSLARTSAGVPAGATRPYQLSEFTFG